MTASSDDYGKDFDHLLVSMGWCVCVWEGGGGLYVCVGGRLYVCACMCVWCVCVCVCVCGGGGSVCVYGVCVCVCG